LEKVVNIPLHKLVKDPMNMRQDPKDVSDLVEEIRTHGWTVPLEARPLKNGMYGVVCGSRRLHAARVLNLAEAPCIVVEMNDVEALRRSMADNELHRELTEEEKVAYYSRMVEVAGGLRPAERKFRIAKETIRGVLERHNLHHLLKDDGDKHVSGWQGNSQLQIMEQKEKEDKEKSKKGRGGQKKKTLPKKMAAKLAKDLLKKKGFNRAFWKQDQEFLSIKKELQEKMSKIKLWEPRVFKRKPDTPALHELLQKPSIFGVTPTSPWPPGWKPISVAGGSLKTLVPALTLGGDFSSVAVMLCPDCGNVLRGLGKGIPVVCLECGFPSNELHGWRRYGGS
jgi:hypothetical protein